ncbi:ComEC/Rec2 family competence protein [Arenibacter sp. GZD96]|uniref:ComEC/Rec2 family competence protein n=1 Tax=Aurantibrevibacter litoralis TaxID=3106030 RepID=UPI002B001582|nr:ComEC/Rec2 family competence protein [Arenibacter sp. GZD-96]MEA1787687.1 ComEC/Rec2 family competence protein [Arenibacter sp. GZD-96]
MANHFLCLDPYRSVVPLLIVLIGLAFYHKKREYSVRFGILVVAGSVFLGMFTYALAQPEYKSHHYSHYAEEKAHLYHLKIEEVLKPNAFSDRYMAQIMGMDEKKVLGKVLLNVAKDTLGEMLHIDDVLLTHAMLEEPKAPLNPYQFNYKKYLRHLGVTHQLYLSAGTYRVTKTSGSTLYGLAAVLRNTIISKLQERNFGAAEFGVIQALFLGQRQDMDPETYDNYINAGAVHILAVSGLHVGVILMLLQWVLQPVVFLPNGRTLKLLLIVLFLWCFAVLAGLSASIVRAVTMFSFVAYAQYLNRPTSTFNILALSMFFILLVNPMFLFQVGFQMSYAAVFAIVWMYPMLQKLGTPKYGILKNGWQLLSVSIAAQLGVLPISLYYFHQFPALFFISNLGIIPFLGLILGLGIVIMILALGQVLPEVLVLFYNSVIRIMNTFIAWVAQQESFLFKSISFDGLQLLLSYVIIISGALLLSKITYKRVVVALSAIICFQIWTIYVHHEAQHKEAVIIAHQTKNSVLLHQMTGQLHVYAMDTLQAQRLAQEYRVGARIGNVAYQSLKNSYMLGSKKIYILDSLAIVPRSQKIEFLVLSQSPTINLDRLLYTHKPEMIIADGSNYRSYVERWRATCKKNRIPFHFTGEKGAFYFK